MNHDEFRRELMRTARDMQNLVHETMTPLCKKHDVTMQHLYILTELHSKSGQTIGQLSDKVGILRTNFTQVCHKMEEKGLIERTHYEGDRRSFTLHLTEEGRKKLAAVNKDIENRYSTLLESESDETYETILKGFAALKSLTGKFETT